MMERKGSARYSHIYLLCNIGLTTGGEKRYRETLFSGGPSAHKQSPVSLSDRFSDRLMINLTVPRGYLRVCWTSLSEVSISWGWLSC